MAWPKGVFIGIRRQPKLRIVIVLFAVAALGLLISRWAPPYVAVLISGLVLALLSTAVKEAAPEIGERVSGQDPLKITVEPDTARLRIGWSVVLPKPLPTDGRPVGGDSLHAREWLVSHAAADMDETYLRLALEGASNASVRVTNLRAIVVSRKRPYRETSAGSPSGGDAAVVGVGFDLEEHDPVARDLVSQEGAIVDVIGEPAQFGGAHFSTHQTTLAKGEVVVFRIVAQAREHCVEWELGIDLSVRGETRTVRIDNGGQPFRTSPLRSLANRDWDWAWYDPPEPKFVEITDREFGRRPF